MTNIDYEKVGTIGKTTAIFVPGWGMTGEIFESWDKPAAHILIHQYDPYTFTEDLSSLIKKEGLTHIELTGYSLGGLVAARAVLTLYEQINALVLISVRDHYPSEIVAPLKKQLRENKALCLDQFYQAMCTNQKDYDRFITRFSHFKEVFSTDSLLNGLSYLEEIPLPTQLPLDPRQLRVIHGKRDRISPWKTFKQWLDAHSYFSNVELVSCGHFVFY